MPNPAMTEQMLPGLKRLEQMNREFAALMPKEFASAVNLMAHPVAGAAAVSALGVGLASHAFGVWMGMVSSAAEASRLAFAANDELAAPPEAPAVKGTVAEREAQPAVVAAPAVPEPEAPAPVVAEVATAAAPAPRQPATIERPASPDDLKAISGIGPKLESVLNGLGIWTYAQVAAWQAGEIGWLDDQLGFRGRIGRDDWIGQAARLAGEGRNG